MTFAEQYLGARPVYERVEGSPWQLGDAVRIVAGDERAERVAAVVGRVGTVLYLEYSCGSGQTYPGDPMIGVRLADGHEDEFWRDELEAP